VSAAPVYGVSAHLSSHEDDHCARCKPCPRTRSIARSNPSADMPYKGTRRNPTGAPAPELGRLRSRSPPRSSTTLQLDPADPATSTLLPTFTPRIADRTPQPPRSRNLATVIHRADTDAHSRSSSLAGGTLTADACEDDLLE
jgi:hypothetical protein